MLTSITPLGERGRGQRWALTATWLAAGHLAGGAALGLLLAATGWGSRSVGISPRESVVVIAIGGAVFGAAVFDVVGARVPGRRQVDERWLSSYRGWVYGSGFGFQLGFGLVTVINTALLGAVLVAGVVLPAGEAMIVGVVYGATRGVCATANGWVRSVGDLRRLHRWIDMSERPTRWAGAALGTAAAVTALVIL